MLIFKTKRCNTSLQIETDIHSLQLLNYEGLLETSRIDNISGLVIFSEKCSATNLNSEFNQSVLEYRSTAVHDST